MAGGRSGGAPLALRYPDVIVLVLALPVFVLADWPLLGYAVCAGAWLAQHGVLGEPGAGADGVAEERPVGDDEDRQRQNQGDHVRVAQRQRRAP